MADEEQIAPEDVQPPGIPKSPVPTAFRWEAVEMTEADGTTKPAVALSVATPLGTHTYFLPPANAQQLGDGVGQLARRLIGSNRMIITPEVDMDAVLKTLGNGKQS